MYKKILEFYSVVALEVSAGSGAKVILEMILENMRLADIATEFFELAHWRTP